MIVSVRALATVAALLSFGAAFAESPEPLAVEVSGQVAIEDERRVAIDGVWGQVVLQLGKPKQLAFASRRPGAKSDDLPIALYSEGGTLRLSPPAGEPAETPRQLTVIVPPELATLVRMERSKLFGNGLRGGLEVRGASLEAMLSGIESDVDLNIEEGAVTATNLEGRLRLRGSKLLVKINGVAGSLDLALNGGTAGVGNVSGPCDAELDGVTLKVETMTGEVRMRARASQVDITGAVAGGDLQLVQTPLKLRGCKGDLTVSTDADVQFNDLSAALHFDSYGGSLRGEGNEGLLEIRTRSAEIALQRIVGSLRIQGEGLKITVRDVSGGETLVYARTSDIQLDSIFGSLTVENDGGDVHVNRATSDVTVKSSGGDVKLLDLNGAVQLEADAYEVEISWASITGDKDSSIRNDRGKVSARFPIQSNGRVEAKSSYGRVESNLARVHVLDDGKEAQGSLGGTNRPVIRIAAGGDVELRAGSGN